MMMGMTSLPVLRVNFYSKVFPSRGITDVGDNVTKGYFENPKATAETIRDGWLCTGDVAVAAKDGGFTILDRKKELLKYEGNQIAPGMDLFNLANRSAQVEALLNCFPDSAVFGSRMLGTIFRLATSSANRRHLRQKM
jgi:non-ribosomal peptide synthetase component E (peptide arylation enzyme)